MKKGIIWFSPPNTSGENLLASWARLMANSGWEITEKFTEQSALIFASSDSQLEKAIEVKNEHPELPLILYFWGYLPERFFVPDYKKLAEVKFRLIQYYADAVFVPNLLVQNQLQYFAVPSAVLIPGIDSAKILTFRGSLFKDLNKVVMIGRLVPHKSHIEILKMFVGSGLSKRFYLHIIGKGELNSDIDKFIKETGVKATVSNDVEDEDKIDILKSALCSIYASPFEGFGAPIAESLFSNTPVIVRESPWARSLFKNSVMYFGSEVELTKSILKIFSGLTESPINPPYVFSGESLTARLSKVFQHIIEQSLKNKLKDKALIAQTDEDFKELYQEEAIRNWETSAYRFNPYWLRHWRVDRALKGLEGASVIDIGCSYGSYAIRFAKAGFNVTAIDIAPFYVEKLRELKIKYGVADKIQVFEDNANSLDFEDNSFDSAWMGEILEHTNNPEQFLKEAIRVVKKNGVIVISTPIGRHHDDPLHLLCWDDERIQEFLNIFKDTAIVEHFDKIAEREGEPSCYLIKLRKI